MTNGFGWCFTILIIFYADLSLSAIENGELSIYSLFFIFNRVTSMFEFSYRFFFFTIQSHVNNLNVRIIHFCLPKHRNYYVA